MKGEILELLNLSNDKRELLIYHNLKGINKGYYQEVIKRFPLIPEEMIIQEIRGNDPYKIRAYNKERLELFYHIRVLPHNRIEIIGRKLKIKKVK